MRVLLDTNIIVHREASKVSNRDVGVLFRWLDQLRYDKCIHPITLEEINRHQDPNTVDAMGVKLQSYHHIKTTVPLVPKVAELSTEVDNNVNDANDTALLNEVVVGRVDLLITEDKKIHRKAKALGVSDRVFRIDSFLEKVNVENPGLMDYKVLSVRKVLFGQVDLNDPFFDSFRKDYVGFDGWFRKKADEEVYVCYQQGVLSAFLFLKVEDSSEAYYDLKPAFTPARRLKIGTFKVVANGFKLGERFLKIVFDNARTQKVDEIYVTIFDTRPELQRLIALLEEYGFKHYGTKTTPSGTEQVYVRDFRLGFDQQNPKLTYPFLSTRTEQRPNKVFLVPINPEYHTKLLPDSILKTEKHEAFQDDEPYRNAISKSYVSHSRERGLKTGDIIVSYRKGEEGTIKKYSSVVTTVGIVDSVHDNLTSLDELETLCKKRTVLTKDELNAYWNRYSWQRPFVVNFLYAFSFSRRANLDTLIQLGIIKDLMSVPRGFEEITWEQFTKLARHCQL